jgi:serine/threonine-protein kinase
VTPRICPTCLTPIPDEAAFCATCGAPSTTRILTPSTSGGVRTDPNSSSYAKEPERLQRALGSNYELGRLIGRGGYAEVFAVRDRKLNRELAIKVLRPDLIVTKSLLARFRREAEAVAALHHRGIVPVYNVGESDEIGFIVMPLIQGESLKRRLLAEARLPVAEAKRILLEAADALAVAHAAGVVHRDIKPENIMLEGPERRVLLMDFGIAKAVDTDSQLTATGVIVGTPQYMSPEQACGDPNVDHRSDQYSLAVVGYQMLSGKVPFEGETARAVMAKQMLDEPPPLWELVEPLPTAMLAALERALSKDRTKRFPTIGDFAAALRQESGVVSPNREKARRAMARVSARRTRSWVAWSTGLMAVAVAGAALTQLRPIQAPLAPPKPETTFVARAETPAPPAAIQRVEPGQILQRPAPPPPPPAAEPIIDRTVTTPARTDSAPAPTPAPPPAAAAENCLTAFERGDWARAYGLCPADAKQSAAAARYAGILLAEGRGGPADPTEALAMLQDAAARGDPPARSLLAMQQFRVAALVEPTDPSRATDLYLGAAQGGVEDAFPRLAQRYEKGIGTPRDLAQAAVWYRRAAEGGHPQSQVRLAELYAKGTGLSRDEGQAARWFREAAGKGHPEAMYQYGLALLNGRGVVRSEAEGLNWLSRASQAGHAEAARELARREQR